MATRYATPNAASAGTLRLGDQLTIHRLGFGAMRLTGRGIWGEPSDREGAKRVLRRALELGITLIDTADSYGPEVSERLIAEALYPYPSELVIATKGGLLRDGPGQWRPDCRPEHLRAACEGSLARLRLERIDVYQLHTIDPRVPVEESVGALADLQREGKIRYVGLSNVNVDQLARARAVTRIVSVQNRYNLGDRAADSVLERCERDGLAFLPWRPVAAGELTQPGGALARVAARHQATPGQVALAWLLRRSFVLVPIPGTSSLAHLEEDVAAASLRLSEADIAELEDGTRV